jgi:hypothetical protein
LHSLLAGVCAGADRLNWAAALMRHIQELAKAAPDAFISCPNAGLPTR